MQTMRPKMWSLEVFNFPILRALGSVTLRSGRLVVHGSEWHLNSSGRLQVVQGGQMFFRKMAEGSVDGDAEVEYAADLAARGGSCNNTPK